MDLTERERRVARLWELHADLPFPAHFRDVDVAGVDLVMVDADIAGCVSTWLGNRGRLDDLRRQILRNRLSDVDRARPLLGAEEELAYLDSLETVGRVVLESR